MRNLLRDFLGEADFDLERARDWLRHHRGALLLGTALLVVLVLLGSGPNQSAEHPQADLAPDETPLFV
ncbi:MAG: hypothetical protein ACE5H2_07240 [Terriglobia bacterium]